MGAYDTEYGPISSEVNIKSVVVPLFAKAEFKKGKSFFIGAGVGTYLMLNVIEITEKTWDAPNIPTLYKTTLAMAGISPAVEFSVGGRAKASDKINFTFSGILGYSLKQKMFGYQEYSSPSLSYKEGFEIGGLSYGGKAGLSFVF